MSNPLPPPGCGLGYTLDQVEMILGQTYWNPRVRDHGLDAHAQAVEIKRFERWMTGQTMGVCQGGIDRYSFCSQAHGTIIYSRDLERYLAGLPVVD